MITQKKSVPPELISRPTATSPQSRPARRLRTALINLACAAAVALGGCASPEAKRAEMGPPQPRLGAKTAFFNGDVRVEVSLVPVASFPGGDPSKGPAGGPPGRGGASSGPRMNIGGGGSVGGISGGGPPGSSGPPGGGGGPAGGGGGPPPEAPGLRPEAPGPRAPMVPLPRQALRLIFSNEGKAAREIEILDVNSLLGNFAPRPARLALDTSQRSEIDPMQSNYAADLDELDVEVRLNSGKTTEKQTIHLIRTDRAGPKP